MRIFIILLLLIPSLAFAEQYENPMPGMEVPSGLEENQAYFCFGARFLSTLRGYPGGNPFNLFEDGTAMDLGARYMTGQGIEAGVFYEGAAMEKRARITLNRELKSRDMRASLSVSYFAFDRGYGPQPVEGSGMFFLLALQSGPLLWERAVFTADIAYDNYLDKLGAAAGVSVSVAKNLDLQAEYYPVIGAERGSGTTGCFVFGVKYKTYGHQFMLKFANTKASGTRSLMAGKNTQDIYAGFELMRMAAF